MSESKLVWSTDNPCPGVDIVVERCNDDIDCAIRALAGGSCSREMARQMADAFAGCLGLTPAEFMKRWRRVFLRR